MLVDHDAIGELIRLGEIVGHHDGRLAPVPNRSREIIAELTSERSVERRKGLVEQQQIGVRGEGSAERHALLLAARELAGVAWLQATEPEPLDHHLRALPAPRRRPTLEAEGDVVAHAEVRKQRVALEDVPEAACSRRAVDAARTVEQEQVVEDHTPGVGSDESGEAVQRQRLAGRPEGTTRATRTPPPPTDVEREAGSRFVKRDGEHGRSVPDAGEATDADEQHNHGAEARSANRLASRIALAWTRS